MNIKKEKKPYTIKNYVVNMSVVAFFILYIVLDLGNIFTLFDNVPQVAYRHIPLFITAFLVTYLMVKSASKKLHKSDEHIVKMVAFIAPIIIAATMFVFEFVNIQSTLSKSQNSLSRFTEVYKSSFGKSIKEQLEEAKKEALLMRFLWSICYIAGGELGALLSVKKVDSLLQDDLVEYSYHENTSSNLDENPISNNSPNTNSAQNINWNL